MLNIKDNNVKRTDIMSEEVRFMNDKKYNIVDYLLPLTDEEKILKQYRELKSSNSITDEFLYSLSSEMRNQINLIKNPIEITLYDSNAFVDTIQVIKVEKHMRFSAACQHSHTFFELIYVMSGFCVNKIQEKVIRMNEGDICFLSPRIVHSLEVLDESIIINIMIRKSMMNETLFNISENSNILIKHFSEIMYAKNTKHYIFFYTKGDIMIRNVFEMLVSEEYMNQYDQYSDSVKQRLLEVVFNYLLRYHSDDAEESKEMYSEHPRIMEVMNYLRHNYRTATLQNLAAYLNYTEQHLSRLIKKETGLNFKEILTKIRIQKACELLKKTDLKILDISTAVGYENTAYFNAVFKNQTNCTPRSYRIQFSK